MGPRGTVRPVAQVVLDTCGQRIVLTRTDPSDPASSVLLRVRPGWDRLRQMLNGEEFVRHCKEPKPPPKLRCVKLPAVGCAACLIPRRVPSYLWTL
jgi:hypothetical protein